MESGNLLSLDVGSTLVGFACFAKGSEELLVSGAFKRAQNRALSGIQEIIVEQQIQVVVAGLPYREDGTASDQGADILAFCRRLHRRAPMPFYLCDESFSTQEVESRMALSTPKKRIATKKSGEIDAQSAVAIGRRFLDPDNTFTITRLESVLTDIGDE
ncbi:MAG: Holliday junction resolvase RuvX [Bdellovibrionales bacterium]|nr:Holliday junction resolvase RuvX [Bdellovibrionales bacterium]